MTIENQSSPVSFLVDGLRSAAASEDDGASALPSVRRLVESGSLASADPVDLCRTLIATAEANLPVARIAEGHVNSLHLLRLHDAACAVDDRAILGIWGADGAAPLTLDGGRGADERLMGGKRYASGLGVVTHAIVTVGSGETGRLALVDVTDADRQRPETWRMQGMRATVSGDVDLTGLTPRWIAGPGDYYREPSFLGGVWRIAALQLGGTLGLLGAARDALNTLERLDADAQVSRLAPLVGRAMAAFGLVERAACVACGAEGARDPERAVALSVQARLLTEDLAQDTIGAVERSVGLAHFAEGAATGRMARDLATYCRQAARDALEQRAGRIALGRAGPLSGLWLGKCFDE